MIYFPILYLSLSHSIHLSPIHLCVLKALLENLMHCQFGESLLLILIIKKLRSIIIVLRSSYFLSNNNESYVTLFSVQHPFFLFQKSKGQRCTKLKWRRDSNKNKAEFGKQKQKIFLFYKKIIWKLFENNLLKNVLIPKTSSAQNAEEGEMQMGNIEFSLRHYEVQALLWIHQSLEPKYLCTDSEIYIFFNVRGTSGQIYTNRSH